MKYSFYDDYSEGAHPEILKYISENNDEQQLGYGNDDYCALGACRVKEAFGIPDADIHFVPNGTLANVIGLVAMLKPFEGIISPDTAHINAHESGAVEAAGHKILWTEAPDGKLTPQRIDRVLERYEDEHTVVPKVVYLTQATELGTAYTKEELSAVVNHAKSNGLYVYLDGARLAVAIANKEFGLTTKNFSELGIDMFYIGGTKNGGIYGEAMVIANDDLKPYFRNHMKQRGALMSKGRFMGQQFARFFAADNLWLSLAARANYQAEKLYTGLKKLGVEFDLISGTNQIFPILPNAVIKGLSENYGFYEWQKVDHERTKIRLVCSWATKDESIAEFIAAVKTSTNGG